MKEIRIDVNMILAGDVGGTKTLLGLFDPRIPRPRPIVVRTFATEDFADLSTVIAAFVNDDRVRGAFIYHVASTGRFQSTGVNFANLPRPRKSFEAAHLNDRPAMLFQAIRSADPTRSKGRTPSQDGRRGQPVRSSRD